MTVNELKEYIKQKSIEMNVTMVEETDEWGRTSHVYSHPTQGFLTGVSTILNVRAKDFLKLWTTKENYNYMVANWDINKVYTEDEKLALLKQAKDAHATKSNKAKDVGHDVHAWIEEYISGKNPAMPDEQKVARAIDFFLEWEKAHRVRWIASELIVASLEHEFAGTLDAIAIVDGQLTLVDFKTSNQISEEYYLQTAGYKICTDEMKIPIAERSILRIPKEKADKPEYVTVPTLYDFDKKTFLHFREAHRWNVYIKNHYAKPYERRDSKARGGAYGSSGRKGDSSAYARAEQRVS